MSEGLPESDAGIELGEASPDEASALPSGKGEVTPRLNEEPSLARSGRTVLLRALVVGALVALAYCGAILLGPGPLEPAAAIQALALGAAVGLLTIGVPSGIECWLATWSEQQTLRGFLLLYLGALLGWLMTGVQLSYLLNVVEGRELSEALVLSVRAASQASPPLLLFHVFLPAALACASLRHIRWLIPSRKGGWRWLFLAILVFGVAGATLPSPRGSLLHVPILILGLAAVVALIYVVVRALQVGLRPEDAERESDLRAQVEVAEGDPPTLGERILFGGDANMASGSLVWLALGLMWAKTGGQPIVAILTTLSAWFIHLILASNMPSIFLARGKPERALALARFFLHHRTRGRLAAQGRVVRLYRETEVRALLQLGRHEEALRYLPEALGEVIEGLADVLTRLRLGGELVQAGFCELCLEVVAPIPRERTATGSDFQAATLEAVALNGLDRPAEALALTEPLLEHPRAKRAKARAVLLNNLAVFQARLGQDLEQALERIREAARLYPALPQICSTEGAVRLAQGDVTAAKPLLEAGRGATLSPHSRAWLYEGLGRCCLALEDPEGARAAFGESVAAQADSKSGRAAQAALDSLS